MRQKIRDSIILVIFLCFPLILNYFSPYLSLEGSLKGIVSGSLALFCILFVTALLFGRTFCGWACPVGCFQDICMKINDRQRPRGHWIKYLIWVPWFSLIVWGFLRAGGIRKVDPLYMTESGISISEPMQFMTYYSVLLLILVLALAAGRHAFCHFGCWIAPFMILGKEMGKLTRVPALGLKADPKMCIDCLTCSRNCPMSIDVHAHVRAANMAHVDCILCGQCADNCAQNVIGYAFGTPRKLADKAATRK